MVTDLREYENKQGFVATLKLVEHSGNNTYGADINPLRLIVRYSDSACSVLCESVQSRIWSKYLDDDSMVVEQKNSAARRKFGKLGVLRLNVC